MRKSCRCGISRRGAWHWRNDDQHVKCFILGWSFVLHASPAGNLNNESGHQFTAMKILAVHPSALMYSKIFLRLEPLGIELIAAAARRAGHDVRLIDLQVEPAANYRRQLDEWRPDAVLFSCNYLANVPEVIDLAKAAAERCPATFVFVGGHSASFIADELLEHGAGAIDCVLKGEGEASVVALLEAVVSGDRDAAARSAGRGHTGRQRAGAAATSRASTTWWPRAICCGIAASTSSACSTRAPRSSFAAAARGIARFAAPGPFTAAATGSRAPTRPSTSSQQITRARRLHRRRRGVHPGRARHGDRRGDRAAGHQEAVLPGNPRRRLAAQSRRVPVLEDARAPVHLPGSRGDRRRGPQAVPQARERVQELRGARVRAVAGRHGRDQHHRRSRLGPPPV